MVFAGFILCTYVAACHGMISTSLHGQMCCHMLLSHESQNYEVCRFKRVENALRGQNKLLASSLNLLARVLLNYCTE